MIRVTLVNTQTQQRDTQTGTYIERQLLTGYYTKINYELHKQVVAKIATITPVWPTLCYVLTFQLKHKNNRQNCFGITGQECRVHVHLGGGHAPRGLEYQADLLNLVLFLGRQQR